MKKLFVGSLAWTTDDESLKQFFGQFGEVTKCEVVKERDNPSRSRGFAFVEFEDDAAADEAIAKGNEAELDGRKITVSEARSKSDSDRGPRGGGYGGGRNDRGGDRGGSFRQRSW
jgi:cold-inducible RNA-binding protein